MEKFEIRTGFESMDLPEVTALLQATYWAGSRTAAQIELSLKNSLCFGVFEQNSGRQVGFARIITDYATTYYLCDVVIREDCRGHGLGYRLVEAVETDPRLMGLRGMLITRDANALYEKFGYGYIGNRFMVKGLNC